MEECCRVYGPEGLAFISADVNKFHAQWDPSAGKVMSSHSDENVATLGKNSPFEAATPKLTEMK